VEEYLESKRTSKGPYFLLEISTRRTANKEEQAYSEDGTERVLPAVQRCD
jgi:hypothetical protein